MVEDDHNDHDEDLDKLDQMDGELDDADDGDVQVLATRSGEPLCDDAAREARAKELKHTQDHNVLEVVWLGEVTSIEEVRSKWLQDLKGNALKALLVARQVPHGNRDAVFASTRPLVVARTLLTLAASRGTTGNTYIGLFDITAAFAHSDRRTSRGHFTKRNCSEWARLLAQESIVRYT